LAGIEDLLGSLSSTLDVSKLHALAGPFTSLIQDNGGLQALLDKLSASGMSEQVNSWLSSAPDIPLTAEQVQQVMSPERLTSMAASAGMTVQETAGALGAMLPALVDKLNVGGSIPGVDQISGIVSSLPGGEQLQGVLGSILGGGSKA
jgi:uncharacterized protein YidB (DUF937 family)